MPLDTKVVPEGATVSTCKQISRPDALAQRLYLQRSEKRHAAKILSNGNDRERRGCFGTERPVLQITSEAQVEMVRDLPSRCALLLFHLCNQGHESRPGDERAESC